MPVGLACEQGMPVSADSETKRDTNVQYPESGSHNVAAARHRCHGEENAELRASAADPETQDRYVL